MATITDHDLQRLEGSVSAALTSGDHSALSVLGYGEISVALGFPADAPTHACKRTPPASPQEMDRYRALVDEYIERLRGLGLTVVDTEIRTVTRDDGEIGYLIQPLLPADSLGHKVLGAAEPDPEHPFLAALGQAIGLVSPSVSIDAQVTNWSWSAETAGDDGRGGGGSGEGTGTGTGLTLLDVGTPFLWDEAGTSRLDMDPFLAMLPAPVRGLVKADLTKMLNRWQEPRGVAADVVANLYREGLDHWVQPTLLSLNRTLGLSDPITAEQARALYDEDLKTWPRLTKLKRLERAWRTRVRRQPYDFFIQTTVGQDALF